MMLLLLRCKELQTKLETKLEQERNLRLAAEGRLLDMEKKHSELSLDFSQLQALLEKTQHDLRNETEKVGSY